ncbi:SCO7613 C-terminal domain-containing membrane protein [Phytomonospora endophytica]
MYPCPRCGAPSSPQRCASCGRGAEPLLTELSGVDATLRQNAQSVARLREQLRSTEETQVLLTAKRSRILARLSARSQELRNGPATPPVPAPPPPPPPVAPVATPSWELPGVVASAPRPPVPQQSAPIPYQPPAQPVYAQVPSAPKPRPETSGKAVQNTLLILGAILAAAAAISFTTVAWVTFGTGGRAAILGTITVITLLLPFVLKKRRLTATAETVSAVGLLLVVLDGVALWLLGLVDDVDAAVFVAGTAIAAAAFGLVYHRLSALLVPLYAVPVLGLLAALVAVGQETTTIGLVLLCAVALLATTAAVAGRDRIAATISGGLAAAAILGTVTYLTAHHAPEFVLIPALAAVAVTAVARRLPKSYRFGPLLVGVIATGLVCLLAFVQGLVAITVALGAGRLPEDAARNVPEQLWQVPVLFALLAVGEFTAPTHTRRHAVAVTAVTAMLVTAPGAFGIDWRVSVPALIAAAAAGAFGARHGSPAESGARLGGSAVVYVFALGLAVRDQVAITAALSTVVLVGVALHLLRRGSAHALPGALGLGVAAWALPGAIASGIDLTGLRPAYTAGIALAVAALAGLAAAVARPAPGKLTALPFAGAAAGLATTAVFVGNALTGAERFVAAGAVPLVLALSAAAVEATQPAAQRETTRRVAAAGAVLVLLAALTTIVYRLLPGFEVLTAVALAALIGLGVVLLPERVRSGPAIGAAIAGGIAATVAAAIAMAGAVVSAAAALPIWTADLGRWSQRLGEVRWLGWQPPIVLLVGAIAAAVLLRGALRHHVMLACAGFALLSAPVAWHLDWPVTPVLAMAGAVALGAAAAFPKLFGGHSLVRLGAGTLFALYALATSLATPMASLAATGAIAAACLLVAGLASGGRQALVGGVATAAGLLVLPAIAISAVVAVTEPDLPGGPLPERVGLLAAMGAASLGLLVTVLLRVGGSRNLPYATATVPVAATIAALASLPTGEPTRVYTALAALIGIAAALLQLPARDAARVRAALSAPALLVSAVAVSPVVLAPLALPYSWILAVWSRVPTSTVDGLSARPFGVDGDVADVAVLAAVALAVLLAVLGLAERRWMIPVAIGGLGAVLLAAPVALDLPWPTGPFTALAIAVVAGLTAGLGRDTRQSLICAVLAAVTGAPALAGSLATRPTTLAALGTATLAAYVVAFAGGDVGRRTAGHVLGGAALSGLTIAAGSAAGLPGGQIALGVLGVALVLLATASLLALRGGRPPQSYAAEVMAHLNLVPALAFAAAEDGVRPLATVFAVYGAMLGLYALRMDSGAVRRVYALVAAAGELLAYWLLLASADIGTVEAYTLPVAVIAIVGGGLELRKRPNLRSWVAYGPGLLALFAPTLAPVLVSTGDPLRRLALGVAALAVLLIGSLKRRQAPVVIGGTVLVLVALHELVLMWTLVPAWLPIAVAAVLLLVTGATFEQRRKDFRRLKAAVGGMR